MSIRHEIEELERITLSPYAVRADQSQGREIPEEPDVIRTCFMRDRDRIIHSKSFRRLKHKTQVYIAPDNDHYRTRLTHTLEVNQIAQTIGRALRLNADLIEAIALGHDVGHTPFSHTGEEVLNSLMKGGFRHNENSVRVLTRLEQRSLGRGSVVDERTGEGRIAEEQAAEDQIGQGLNLTVEVLDGILHHSGYGKRKNPCQTLEGNVVRYADKIAYVQHDIDDSIRAGVLKQEEIPARYLEVLGRTHSERIGSLVSDLVMNSRKNLQNGIPLIMLSARFEQALSGLRDFMFEYVYLGPYCLAQRDRAVHTVEYLFGCYKKNPDRLPEFYRQICAKEGIERGVADYISGMTDNFCIAAFKELALPRQVEGYVHAEPDVL